MNAEKKYSQSKDIIITLQDRFTKHKKKANLNKYKSVYDLLKEYVEECLEEFKYSRDFKFLSPEEKTHFKRKIEKKDLIDLEEEIIEVEGTKTRTREFTLEELFKIKNKRQLEEN